MFGVLSARSRSSFAVYVESFDAKCRRWGLRGKSFISSRAGTSVLNGFGKAAHVGNFVKTGLPPFPWKIQGQLVKVLALVIGGVCEGIWCPQFFPVKRNLFSSEYEDVSYEFWWRHLCPAIETRVKRSSSMPESCIEICRGYSGHYDVVALRV